MSHDDKDGINKLPDALRSSAKNLPENDIVRRGLLHMAADRLATLEARSATRAINNAAPAPSVNGDAPGATPASAQGAAPTPRTDAAILRTVNIYVPRDDGSKRMVFEFVEAAVAREIERELSEARSQAGHLQAEINGLRLASSTPSTERHTPCPYLNYADHDPKNCGHCNESAPLNAEAAITSEAIKTAREVMKYPHTFGSYSLILAKEILRLGESALVSHGVAK